MEYTKKIVRNEAPAPGRYTCVVFLSFPDHEERAEDIIVDVAAFYDGGTVAPKHAVVTLHGISHVANLEGVALYQNGESLFGGTVKDYAVEANSTIATLDGISSHGRFIYP